MDSIHLFLKKINTLRLTCLDIFGENILRLLRYLEIILDIPLCVSVRIEGGCSRMDTSLFYGDVGRTKCNEVLSTILHMW